MVGGVAQEILARVSWGLMFRAYFGAGMSFMDLVSDSYMIRTFLKTGRSGAGYALVCMVGGNLVFQLLFVIGQTAGLTKNKWRTMFIDILSVVSFTKPGWDAHRLASGAERQPGALVDPLAEAMATKICEMVFEGVPGLVVQLVAFMQAEDTTTSAVISLLISLGSTAMTSTVLFYDMETHPGARKRNPKWWAFALAKRARPESPHQHVIRPQDRPGP